MHMISHLAAAAARSRSSQSKWPRRPGALKGGDSSPSPRGPSVLAAKERPSSVIRGSPHACQPPCQHLPLLANLITRTYVVDTAVDGLHSEIDGGDGDKQAHNAGDGPYYFHPVGHNGGRAALGESSLPFIRRDGSASFSSHQPHRQL